MSDKVKVICKQCKQKNNHTVAATMENPNCQSGPGDDNFYWSEHFQIVVCDGCGTPSFRRLYFDETMYGGPEETAEADVTLYPNPVVIREEIDDWYYIPIGIRGIYKEAIHALNEKLLRLAGMGLRATIEAICEQEDCKVQNDLPASIIKLEKSGKLSAAQAGILAPMKDFLNMLTHEIFEPPIEHLQFAWGVVEGLLNTLYIHPETDPLGRYRKKKTPSA